MQFNMILARKNVKKDAGIHTKASRADSKRFRDKGISDSINLAFDRSLSIDFVLPFAFYTICRACDGASSNTSVFVLVNEVTALLHSQLS